jgi:hypothetical protein
MSNKALDDTAERLFGDRRLMRRFRRNPHRALRGSGLSTREVDALKRGDGKELLELGLDRRFLAKPAPANAGVLHDWMLRNARRLVPASLLGALALTLGAATAPAGGGRVSKRRAQILGYRDDPAPATATFFGKVKSADPGCKAGAPARLFLDQRQGPDVREGSDKTSKNGAFEIHTMGHPFPGLIFYVLVKARRLKDGDRCKPDGSPDFTVRTLPRSWAP